MSVKFEGLQTILNNLDKYSKSCPEALGAALYQEAESVMAKSVQYCPVDTSALLMSRFISRPSMDAEGIKIALGYGKIYAIWVHEMPTNVNWTKPGSGPKYLTRAVDERRRGFVTRLAARTKRNIETGVGMDVKGTNPETPTE